MRFIIVLLISACTPQTIVGTAAGGATGVIIGASATGSVCEYRLPELDRATAAMLFDRAEVFARTVAAIRAAQDRC